jgi:colanic acid/amylovoran biosynthesis glycosyltransferase
MKLIPTTEISAETRSAIANGQKPRIAYLLSQYPAISHTFFLNEVLGLKQLGFQIETCSINPPDRPLDLLTTAEAAEARRTYYVQGVNYWGMVSTLFSVLFGHPRVCLRGIRAAVKLGTWDVYRHFYHILYLVEALLIGAWMKRCKLDHLHVHFGGAVATVGFLASHAWGFSYSLTIHGPEEFYDVERYYLTEKFRDAEFIFCISNFCRSQVMKYSPPPQWKNLHVVPLGVDPQHFRPQPRPAADALLQIASVGRLVPAKGQLILLSSLRQLLKKGHGIHLTFIGDGSDRKLLEAYVTEHQLTGSVTFTGALNHDQTRARLAQSDIFVLPSFAEGVPVALMEAMAMEIPCVSTLIAGIPELIDSEVDGLLVPASSDEVLAAAIERLIRSPELRAQLGGTARKKVINGYNLNENLGKLAAAFEECLAGRNA